MMNSDETLLAGANRFDEQALAEIYDLFSPGLFRYAARLLGDPDMAEECVAETFSRFLTALKRGRGPRQNLRAYLYRISHNWITDSYRRQPLPPLPLDADLVQDPEAGPSQALLFSLERQKVRRALLSLTPDQRQVVLLKYYEGWQNEDIAQALDKPIGAVKALQHRAINALRRVLAQEKEEVHG